ncbi:MAG: methyltransferase domain-containing protein [Phycisphaerales bacterium]|nr:methyltransferase domain-containing protein [Phycisphaerales bacterium]
MSGRSNFFREFLRSQSSVGAIAPSSRALARAITRPARAWDHPRRWLEVGPGTGVFTRALIRDLGEGDHLDVVELNPAFCQHLRTHVLEAGGSQVKLHEGSITEVDLEGGYDSVVCGLPYNAFPTHVSRSILRRLVSLIRPGGTLSFFEYAAIRHARRLVGNTQVKRAMIWHERFIQRLETDMSSQRDLVLCNLPPAWAVHLTTSKEPR